MRYHYNGDSVQDSNEMATLVAAYRKSNLGLRRFAREYKIPPGRLHYWVYQKHRHSRPRQLAQSPRSRSLPAFQEVKLGGGSALMENWAAEVSLAGGLRVRFSSTAAPAWIGAVMEALQRPC